MIKCNPNYAPKAKLVVQVDGSQHKDSEHAPADLRRDSSTQIL